ncbi:putative lipopolysaccharide biosynthesis O-acetyl transferase wbbJ [Shewanella benthica]|uniref:Putative lipopolysaccharide biosynthesis O-acetyl transferase wbbJ n=1 Tax=Shewanella benthica TaxID=43661 RepID=A0A330MCD3_9GAMM|nr:DapH/DapD/GlmU-related protein [Shewanella benthica]SQH77487.1 putative lipopolysaccharide biosynthesis O-acetyl transferase wbbJ [Shewanella benthica]
MYFKTKILKGYTVYNFLITGTSFLYTKIFYNSAKLIRLPFRFRCLGEFSFGSCLTIGVHNRFDVFEFAKLNIGDNVQINDYCHLACADNVSIGNDTLIASRVFITDHDHDFNSGLTKPADWPLLSLPVTIGQRCWIGEGVCILKGVSLGNDCIVGANSVVTKNFPSGSIIGGVPAKLIRNREVIDNKVEL